MYMVPGLKLIPQQRDMACWYASAQMIIQWKREWLRMTIARHPDPSELNETGDWEVTNQGITNPRVVQLAKLLGFETVPALSPSLEYLETLIRTKGPLWTNGKSHIVVLGGIDSVAGKLYVYDPWPPGVGKVEWRPLGWYINSPQADSRDTSAAVQAVFLYHP